jgi:hypothetical protein
MRDPATPEAAKGLETETSTATPGPSGVSIPDRRRIDSDVRAFLREPSTPWIVFDREGRPPSQLAVGEVLSVPRKTLLSDYHFDFFPSTAAVDAAAESVSSHSKVEPSSLAVASDLADDASLAAVDRDVADAPGEVAIPMFGLSRRVLGASAGVVAALSILAISISALAIHNSSSDSATARSQSAATQPAARTFGGPVQAEIPPPDLDAKPAAPAERVPAPAAAASVASRETAPAPAKAAPAGPKKIYGRLSITGDARSKDVFLDGKRLLGRGARNFTVMCGAHTISIGVRNDPHDADVPCGAELVISK